MFLFALAQYLFKGLDGRGEMDAGGSLPLAAELLVCMPPGRTGECAWPFVSRLRTLRFFSYAEGEGWVFWWLIALGGGASGMHASG